MLHPYRRWFKRPFDASLAAAGLLFFGLPMLWIASRIRRELRRPALFLQERIGRGGARFVILKFRTMNDRAEVASPFCRRLRDTALDELPQLVNILRGEMSFVGPRPLIPKELQDLERVPGGRRRLSVRPGLAGLTQLRRDKTPPLEERLRTDMDYIDRCSFLLDLRILLASIGVTGRGGWERPGPKSKIR
jgi:lipopolysaccharide/colanic/teichoic acid biosynthesis glycosyltransferase